MGTSYGTASGGGAFGNNLCSQANCVDGWSPEAALIQATNGNLYGAAARGGANGGSSGTIFEITPGGTLTTLYNFCSQGGCTDGDQPYAGLIQATNRDFYGTTAAA